MNEMLDWLMEYAHLKGNYNIIEDLFDSSKCYFLDNCVFQGSESANYSVHWFAECWG